MSRIRNPLIVMALAALFILPASSAFAQGRRKGGGGGGGMGGNGGGMTAPPVNPALAGDREQVSTASTTYTKANKDYNDAVKKFTDDYEKQDDYKNAQDGVDKANKDLDAARTQALADLKKSDPNYKASFDKETAANAKLEQMRANGAKREDISAEATVIFQLDEDISKMESAALDKDQGYQDAKKKLADATQALKDQKDKLADAIKNDPNLSTLKQARDTAQAALDDAKKKLASDGG